VTRKKQRGNPLSHAFIIQPYNLIEVPQPNDFAADVPDKLSKLLPTKRKP